VFLILVRTLVDIVKHCHNPRLYYLNNQSYTFIEDLFAIVTKFRDLFISTADLLSTLSRLLSLIKLDVKLSQSGLNSCLRHFNAHWLPPNLQDFVALLHTELHSASVKPTSAKTFGNNIIAQALLNQTKTRSHDLTKANLTYFI
jgi:CHAT domain-containing protein